MGTLLIVVAFLVAAVLVLYNSLVRKKNDVENAFASIDVFLKQRFDLVPNLVACVRGYARHEADTLAKVAELRAQAAAGGRATNDQVALDNQLSAGLARLLVSVEAYPDLKASAHFEHLSRTLNEIEEQLSASRRAFNAAVTDYNTAIQMFPGNLLAGPMGFGPRVLLTTPEAERANVNAGELLRR